METITDYLIAGYRFSLGPIYRNNDDGKRCKIILRYRHFEQTASIPYRELEDQKDDTVLIEHLEDLRGKLDYARNQVQF